MMSNLFSKQIILVDFDNTIADWVPTLRKYLCTNCNCETMQDFRDTHSHIDIDLIVQRQHFTENLEAMQGSIHTLKQMMDRYDIYICSSIDRNHYYTSSEKVEWVRKHIPELIDRIILTSDKSMIHGEYLLDDKKSIVSLRSTWTHITFGDTRSICKNWAAVEELFLRESRIRRLVYGIIAQYKLGFIGVYFNYGYYIISLGKPDIVLLISRFFIIQILLNGGVVYPFNDLIDMDIDKHHPEKQKRPLPSGLLLKKDVLLFIIFHIILLVTFLPEGYESIVMLTLCVNILYTCVFKHTVYRYAVVSLTQVIRALAGIVDSGGEVYVSTLLYIYMTTYILHFEKSSNKQVSLFVKFAFLILGLLFNIPLHLIAYVFVRLCVFKFRDGVYKLAI